MNGDNVTRSWSAAGSQKVQIFNLRCSYLFNQPKYRIIMLKTLSNICSNEVLARLIFVKTLK